MSLKYFGHVIWSIMVLMKKVKELCRVDQQKWGNCFLYTLTPLLIPNARTRLVLEGARTSAARDLQLIIRGPAFPLSYQ